MSGSIYIPLESRVPVSTTVSSESVSFTCLASNVTVRPLSQKTGIDKSGSDMSGNKSTTLQDSGSDGRSSTPVFVDTMVCWLAVLTRFGLVVGRTLSKWRSALSGI